MFRTFSYLFVLFHISSYFFVPVRTCSCMFVRVHTCSYLFGIVRTCSYSFVRVHVFSCFFRTYVFHSLSYLLMLFHILFSYAFVQFPTFLRPSSTFFNIPQIFLNFPESSSTFRERTPGGPGTGGPGNPEKQYETMDRGQFE